MEKPKPPLNKILIENRFGWTGTCVNCHSSLIKIGFLGIFGEILCINQECPNSVSRMSKKKDYYNV